ncbi:hypothetical protein D9758_006022 [Tetrapyrgos nigripes]|uniref:Uncharacterized protein n=1 Tax=Tetrapyrgos nigripes TaxID=182062 RepID=A0A8H5D7Z7_9AGAR|nr:hypothetical protein D9758_006022 [Tetrapyrgos nigripes]
MPSPVKKLESKRTEKTKLKNEADWEDVTESDSEDGSMVEVKSSASSPSRRMTPIRVGGSPRKRRLLKEKSSLSATYIKREPKSPPRSWKEEVFAEGWFDNFVRVIWSVFGYVIAVFTGSFKLLLRPLSFLLFLFILALIFGRVVDTFRMALKPFCFIPGVSSSSMCLPDSPHPIRVSTPARSRAPKWADYPKLIDAQTSFEQLLDNSAGGSGLALNIKKAEMATKDLVVLVRDSKLTSKNLLADSLINFVEDARQTGRGLQRLGSKTAGAVDQIVAVNDYALHAIEDAQAKGRSPLSIRSLIPFFPKSSTDDVVLKTFSDAMHVLSSGIQRLVLEAEVQRTNLEKLEEHLSVIHELVSREDAHVSAARAELLAYLWTHLGGHRKEMKGFDDHLKLLKGLAEYRKRALLHVVSALQTLHALSDDMEDLRERVTAPQLVGGEIPLDVHMKSISLGLERLKQSRINAAKREEDAVRKVLGIEEED